MKKEKKQIKLCINCKKEKIVKHGNCAHCLRAVWIQTGFRPGVSW